VSSALWITVTANCGAYLPKLRTRFQFETTQNKLNVHCKVAVTSVQGSMKEIPRQKRPMLGTAIQDARSAMTSLIGTCGASPVATCTMHAALQAPVSAICCAQCAGSQSQEKETYVESI
jgi:hypothetical protein